MGVWLTSANAQELCQKARHRSPVWSTQPWSSSSWWHDGSTRYTPPKFNSSPLKMDGWNTIVSFWDGLFSLTTLVSGRVYQKKCGQKKHQTVVSWCKAASNPSGKHRQQCPNMNSQQRLEFWHAIQHKIWIRSHPTLTAHQVHQQSYTQQKKPCIPWVVPPSQDSSGIFEGLSPTKNITILVVPGILGRVWSNPMQPPNLATCSSSSWPRPSPFPPRAKLRAKPPGKARLRSIMAISTKVENTTR